MNRTFNLLVVDDCEIDRDICTRRLKQDTSHSYNILYAETGDDALVLCRENRFDCVLLDYSLPGADGLIVLDDLISFDRHSAVVMLTGSGDERLATEAMKRGAQDYLPKDSMSSSALKRSLHNTIDRVAMLRRIDAQQNDLRAFANILAHDLMAPINVIRGMNGLIFEALEDCDYSEVAAFSDRIERSAFRMHELISMLKRYNKAKDETIQIEMTCLRTILDDVLNNLHLKIEQSGVVVTHDTLPSVLGDAPQLLQLLQNLIENAIKYCTADTPRIHLGVRETDSAVTIAISDNGIGISEVDISDIFLPFKRLHDDEEYSGSGLGLATCHRIVQRHGGDIWCTSRKSEGSTFHFSLPKSISQAVTADMRYANSAEN